MAVIFFKQKQENTNLVISSWFMPCYEKQLGEYFKESL